MYIFLYSEVIYANSEEWFNYTKFFLVENDNTDHNSDSSKVIAIIMILACE